MADLLIWLFSACIEDWALHLPVEAFTPYSSALTPIIVSGISASQMCCLLSITDPFAREQQTWCKQHAPSHELLLLHDPLNEQCFTFEVEYLHEDIQDTSADSIQQCQDWEWCCPAESLVE